MLVLFRGVLQAIVDAKSEVAMHCVRVGCGRVCSILRIQIPDLVDPDFHSENPTESRAVVSEGSLNQFPAGLSDIR